MKNIAKFILGIGLVSLTTSCSDFLDQSSPSEMTDPFHKESDAQKVLNKVYAGLTVDNTYGCRLPINFCTNSDIELVDAYKTDAETHSNNERGACNYNATPGWDKLDKNWSAMYEIAENATTVIEGVDKSDILKSGSKSEIAKMRRYKAEAVTLRAMIYYDLIKNYGDIPVKWETTQPDGSNMYVNKSDRDDIMDRLLQELKNEAIPYLPWIGEEGYTAEHITKGFAHGLAARIALSYAGYSIREKAKDGYETLAEHSDNVYPTQRPSAEKRAELYQIALDNTTAIINNGTHQLNPSFDGLWTASNMLQADPYNENLFEVAHGLNYSGEMGYTAGIRINGSSNRFGVKGNSAGKVKLTAMHFMSYNRNDERRDVTCAAFEIKESLNISGKTEEVMQANSPFSLYVAKWDVRKMEKNSAWLNTVQASTDKVGYGINWIVMRYADVLLMYAESLYELKQDANIAGPANNGLSALDALKQVHKRAFADKSLADSEIDKYVGKVGYFETLVQERAWEFAGEGIRKYDLIRWGLLYDRAVTEFAKSYNSLNAGAKNKFSGERAPEMLFYKLTKDENGNIIIDPASVCWYVSDAPADESEYEKVDWWTKDDKGKNAGYLEFISSGLTGKESGVVGRHLLPLGNTSISDSKGTLYNSYGY